MRMQLDAAEVHDPCETGRVVDDNFFSGASRRKRKGDGPQPLRAILRRTLLIKRWALGAIHEALEHTRPIADAGDSSARDGQIVLNDVELGELYIAREVGLVRIGHPYLASFD